MTSPAPFRSQFRWFSGLRYVLWSKTGFTDFQGTMTDGTVLVIPRRPREFFWTVWEIFQDRVYATDLAPSAVAFIVDLGGNVGYATLFYAARFPGAKILAFEPHPGHIALYRRHVRLNRLESRVDLVEAAASTRPGSTFLTDRNIFSATSDTDGTGIPVPVVDFFDELGLRPVDLLKIDIEGGEYPIMKDPRFEAVAARTRQIILEWHKLNEGHAGRDWCIDRLENLGFEVQADSAVAEHHGILRATRPVTPTYSALSAMASTV